MALATMPRVMKNFSITVAGRGYIGIAEEVRLPDLRLKIDEHRGAGMDMPIPIDLGMEKIDIGFTLAEHNEDVFKYFGLVNQNAVAVTFRGAMRDDTTPAVPYIITAQGMYQEIRQGTIRNGDRNRLEAMISCRYYLLSIGGVNLIEIDADNFIRSINGVDQLADMRQALGMD